MNKKKPKIREILPTENEIVNVSDDGGCRETNVEYQIKNYKGRSVFTLKFLLITILLYFIRIDEARTINPVQDITGSDARMNKFPGFFPDQNKGDVKDEFNEKLDRNLAKYANKMLAKRKHGSDDETTSTDTSTSDTDSDDDSSFVLASDKTSSVGDENKGSDSEPIVPEAKKILAQHKDRKYVYDSDYAPDLVVDNSRPFTKRSSNPLQSNMRRVFDANPVNSEEDSGSRSDESDGGNNPVNSEERQRDGFVRENPVQNGVVEQNLEGDNSEVPKESIAQENLNDVGSVNDSESLVPPEEHSPVTQSLPDVGTDMEAKNRVLGGSEVPVVPNVPGGSSEETSVAPVQEPRESKTDGMSTLSSAPGVSAEEKQDSGWTHDSVENVKSGENKAEEKLEFPGDQESVGEVGRQAPVVLNRSVPGVPLGQGQNPILPEKVEPVRHNPGLQSNGNDDLSRISGANGTSVRDEFNVSGQGGKKVVPVVVGSEVPNQSVEGNVPKQSVINENRTPVPKPGFDELEASEEVSAPPKNAFAANLNRNLPQEASFLGGKEGSVTPSDDFDLKEVEKVDVRNLDPHITQEVDNVWLKKQKQNQMIGSQIPVATSYEYNRNAHVLEPKFESPKIIGGIIQTLTDKESKLRRATKRKLKIQHDLNLYISKESAAVVNMLNNGEVNRLQRMHPLVFMRLQEVFHTQYALDNLVRKDGDKVKRYDKNWYLNSSPTVKASFIEEIRKYSKEPELYGKFKKPKKIKESRESVYNKLELFHNDYICQRVVRENQYAEKVLRSLEQQSGLYLAPFYHNIVPGLGSLWLMKNFERYFMEAFRSKVTTFGKIAPTLVGRFMLMVENGTVLPSTPSSQVAIHALTIMLSHIMDGVKEPRTFLGKRKFYGFMSLCDTKCVDRIFEEKDSKRHLALKQIEFLRWVFAFHSEDLLLLDTYAQKVVLNNMYAVTREDIYRTSRRNIQLRIQSEFSAPKRGRRPSFLELVGNGEDSFLQEGDKESETSFVDRDPDESMLELESGLSANYEGRSSDQNRRLLRQHEEQMKRDYRRMQLEKLLEEQRRESQKQQDEKEGDTFQKAMREREEILRRSQQNYNKPRPKDEYKEKALFVKEENELTNKEIKELEKEKDLQDTSVYETVRNKFEGLGSTYKVFLKRFMSGYHAPGKGVDVEATSDAIVPFYVFVPFNKTTGGYDDQFLDVVQTLTDLVNLAYKDFNVYFQTLNTYLMIRTVHSALHSFENSDTKKISGSRTMGSLFRWLNTDSNRYLSHVPKKYLPFSSLSLQLVFFFQELVENYSNKVASTLRSFFKGLVRFNVGRTTSRPLSFAKLNRNLEPSVIYNANRYRASLDALNEMVKLFKNTFISKPSIPSPVIQYISVFTGLWAQVDSESFSLSDKGTHRARKMFLLSFLCNKKGLADMATEMILKNCAGLRMLHLGCVFKTTSEESDCNQISVKLKKKRVLHIMRVLESTSLDPLDVIRIASDTCRRCVANLKVRPHVGVPVASYLEMSEENGSEAPESGGYLESDPDDDETNSVSSESSVGSGSHMSDVVSMVDKTPKDKGGIKEYDDEEGLDGTQTPVDKNKHWYDFIKKPFKKELTPEEEALLLPHFVDRLMLHSEITHRVHCYVTQKKLVKSLLSALDAAKDEVDAKQIVVNVFGEYRTIEVIQSGMASSIHRLICPYMIDAQDSVRIPLQMNIIKYVVDKLANKKTPNIFFTDLFKGLQSKIDLLIPDPNGFHELHDLPGCVFVGSRVFNGIYYSGGYAPFSKIDKPTNIMLKPGEGRLVYDGDNFVPELTALQDVSDLESINVVHERDFDRIVYQVRGNGGPTMMTERGFALEYPNFVVRAHVLVTAKALLRMGFDMGRIIWCGDRYGWVADFVLQEVVPLSDVPVYNGQYWLLTSQLSVKDVVGNIPVKFLNDKFRNVNVTYSVDEDEEHLPDKNIGELNVEITARGKKVGEIRAHSPGVEGEVETPSDEENDATELLVGSGGDSMSATPGAVKSVRSATFNPVGHKLTLDLDMPDFVFGQ